MLNNILKKRPVPALESLKLAARSGARRDGLQVRFRQVADRISMYSDDISCRMQTRVRVIVEAKAEWENYIKHMKENNMIDDRPEPPCARNRL